MQCYGCGRAIPSNESKSIHYIEGVSCDYFIKARTIKQIQSSSTRQEQIIRARILI